jgi:hypothetical protein
VQHQVTAIITTGGSSAALAAKAATNKIPTKRLELLHELLPNVGVIAMLVNPNNELKGEVQEAQDAADRLGVKLIVLNAVNEDEIDALFRNHDSKRSWGGSRHF